MARTPLAHRPVLENDFGKRQDPRDLHDVVLPAADGAQRHDHALARRGAL